MIFFLRREELYNPIKRSPPILAVAFIPNSNYALSSGLDFVLRKWDLRSGECLNSWEAGGPLNAIAVNPSGEWALLSTVMGALQWDLQRWQFIRSYLTNKGATENIAYADNLRMVIGAGEDSLIYRWDLETGEKHKSLADHHYPVSAISVGDFDELLLSGDSSGQLRLWDLSTGECQFTWQGHTSKITDLELLSHSQRAITVSQGEPIKIWDIIGGQLLDELPGHKGWIEALAVSKQENMILSAGEDGLRIWDLEHRQNTLMDNSADIICLAFSRNEKTIIGGGRDGSLSIWSFQ